MNVLRNFGLNEKYSRKRSIIRRKHRANIRMVCSGRLIFLVEISKDVQIV